MTTATKALKFTPELAQASLDGRKTQTRRPIKPQPESLSLNRVFWLGSKQPTEGLRNICPYGQPGTVFQIDGVDFRITDVRVERLMDISEKEAQAEGVKPTSLGKCYPGTKAYEPTSYVAGFKQVWNSIYGDTDYRWDENPWVWRIEYGRVEA